MIRLWLKPVESYNGAKADELYRRFARNHTWQTPTLVLLRALASLDKPSFTNDPRIQYMPVFLRGFWNPKSEQNQAIMHDMAGLKRAFPRSIEEVGKLHRAGVEILAGTDTPFLYCFPGFSVNDELALLVQAGLTPMEALQSATCNPARYLGRLKDEGTVEKGKRADLVLLDADPMKDIRNTRHIAAVIVGGKLLTRATLRKMLVDAAGNSGAK